MAEVRFTNEFEAWWDSLDEEEQISVARIVNVLAERGVNLGHPHSSAVLRAK